MTEALLLTVFPLCVAFGGVTDLLTLRIPNRVSLILCGSFLIVAPLAGLGLTQIGLHIAGALGLLFLGFILFALNYIGGGDAKLLPAIGLWLGPMHIPVFLLLITAIGGFLALMLIKFRWTPLPRLAGRFPWAVRLHEATSGMPYGVAIAAAALVVYINTPITAILL